MASVDTDPRPRRRTVRLAVIASAVAAAVGIGAAVVTYSRRASAPSRPRIALITSSANSYWDPLVEGAEASAREHDVELRVVRSPTDVAVQSTAIRDMLADHYDGIGVSPVDPAAQAALLQEVNAKSKLVTFDSDAPRTPRLAFVGSDNYDAGWLCADQVREACPEGGEVLISVGSVDKANGRARRQGLIDNLLDRRHDEFRPADAFDREIKGDAYTVVATLVDHEDFDAAVAMAAKAMRDHPDLACAVGLFNLSTPALLKAAAQAGRLGAVKIVGFDDADATQRGIEAGTVFSSILQDPYYCGYETVRILADAARGVRPGGPAEEQKRISLTHVMNRRNIEQLRREHHARTPSPTTAPLPPGAASRP